MDVALVHPAPATARSPAAPPAPAAFGLRTARLVMREFTNRDEADLRRMHRDPRVRAHLLDDAPLHRAAVATLFVQRMRRLYREHPGLGIWHASVCTDGTAERFAGWFSLMPLPGHPGEVELGSRLLPAHWGRSLSLDGGEALLQHAFDTLRLPRVWGTCHPDNRGARLCLAALGFGPGALAPGEDGQTLLCHRLDVAAWRRVCDMPRRLRLQQAARSLHDMRQRTPAGEPAA